MVSIKKLADGVFLANNEINSLKFIELVEKSSKAYPFLEVERRPHLTMDFPLNFDKKDNIDCINLRYETYKVIMPSIIDYINMHNLENMWNRKSYMLWSKLFPGKGMGPHVDNQNSENNHFVCMFYINSNFEGGELIFNDLNITYTPSSGDLLIFKASLTHEVLPVKNGIRYNAVYGLIDDKSGF